VDKQENKFADVLKLSGMGMLLRKRKYSLIIVPPENGRLINKEISQRFIVICSLVISLFVILSVYTAVGFIRSAVDKQKLANLAQENQVLSAKLGDLESTVTLLKGEMSKIIGKDEQIRLVFDFPPIDSDVREVGIGGDIGTEPVVNNEMGQRTWLVQEDIEKIRRQIELENASTVELLGMVNDRKSQLDHTPTIVPCDGFVSRGYGMHNDPFTGSYQLHKGIDIAAPKGTPVYATANGIVARTSYQAGLGNLIVLDHGDGYSTYYGHLSKVKVAPGHRVTRGELIGLVGSTGYSTGPHLHYEVHENGRALDPSKFIIKSILALY
jgi:murein DD-endopeptidase MepM/ murein hydrolase activator NlpD